MKKFVYRLKDSLKNFKINFKKKLKESKEKPKSKRKSFMIGFATVVGIFSLTLFGRALPAVAKDIPKANPKPTDIAPAPAPDPTALPTKKIGNRIVSGIAATTYSLAVQTGSFAVGVACGCIVVVGILYMQGE
jgi:hypothetical protein